MNAPGRPAYYGLNTLYIGLPCTVSAPVGVTDLDAKRHALIANFTLRHLNYPPPYSYLVTGLDEETAPHFYND